LQGRLKVKDVVLKEQILKAPRNFGHRRSVPRMISQMRRIERSMIDKETAPLGVGFLISVMLWAFR
jgi:hypothetical protein